MQPSIFISYATSDQPWAKWVQNELLALNIEVEVDFSEWHAGASCPDRINAALLKHELFLALWSNNYFINNSWSKDEFEAAYYLNKYNRIIIIPLLINKEISIPPLYNKYIHINLFSLTEKAARTELRRQLSHHFSGNSILNGPLPRTKVDFPQLRPNAEIRAHRTLSQMDIALIKQGDQQAKRVLDSAPQSATPVFLADIAGEIKRLSRSYASEPPAAVLKQSIELFENLRIASESEKQNPLNMADIYVMESRLFGIQSYATLDMGSPHEALRNARAMVLRATIARHSELVAWGYGTQSMILRFQGQLDTATRKAEEGLANKPRGMSAARLHCQMALNWSEKGNTQKTFESLELSEKTVEGSPESPEEADGIFFFSPAKHHYYAGCGLLNCPPRYSKDAEKESRKALKLFAHGNEDTRSLNDELLATIHLSTAIYRQGRIEEILESLTRLLKADPAFRTAWHYLWLQRLSIQLTTKRRYRGAEATRKIVAAVEDFCSDKEASINNT